MFPHDDFVIEPLPSHMSTLHNHRHHHGYSHHHNHGNSHHKNHGNDPQHDNNESYGKYQHLDDIDLKSYGNYQHLDHINLTSHSEIQQEDKSIIHHSNSNHDNRNSLHNKETFTQNNSIANESSDKYHIHDNILSVNNDTNSGDHDNQYSGEQTGSGENVWIPHIMYRRSALFKHNPENYETSKGKL